MSSSIRHCAERSRGLSDGRYGFEVARQPVASHVKAHQRGQVSEEQRLQEAENAELDCAVAQPKEEISFLKRRRRFAKVPK